ncbi:MAG: hypothetical protein WEB58_17430 [Planctomycetaceae bacterium]
MQRNAHFSALCARHNPFSLREKVAAGRMRVPLRRKNAKKTTKNDKNRRFARICAQFSAKNCAGIDVVSEIELKTPSAFTNASPVLAIARYARTSSRARKPATFVDEAPLKSPIQEAEANQATQNHPPLPNMAVPQQTGPKYGYNGESRMANIAAKSCFDMHFACTKRAQKCHSRAQKRHSRAQKRDFARISAHLRTSLNTTLSGMRGSGGVGGQWSVVRRQWSVKEPGEATRPAADPLRATMRR